MSCLIALRHDVTFILLCVFILSAEMWFWGFGSVVDRKSYELENFREKGSKERTIDGN